MNPFAFLHARGNLIPIMSGLLLSILLISEYLKAQRFAFYTVFIVAAVIRSLICEVALLQP